MLRPRLAPRSDRRLNDGDPEERIRPGDRGENPARVLHSRVSMASHSRKFRGSEVHANAVVVAARAAAMSGDTLKATVLYRSIVEHHPLSKAAREGLDFLVTRKVVENPPQIDNQESVWTWPPSTRRRPERAPPNRQQHFI